MAGEHERRRPSWAGKNVDPKCLTPERLDAMRREAAEVDAHNQAAYANLTAALETYRAALRDGTPLSGFRSLTVKRNGLHYVLMPISPIGCAGDIARFEQSRREWEKRQEAERQAAEEAAEREQLKARAVIWLHGKGMEPGTYGDALEYANHLAFEIERARLLASAEWHKVQGDSCEGACKGWDGSSRRCQCGDTRCRWTESDGHTFENPSVYATGEHDSW